MSYPFRSTPAWLAGLSALLLCTSIALTAQAEPVRICTENHSHPPYFFVDHDGSIVILLKMAAANAGIDLAFHSAPARRCVEEIRSNESNALAAAAAAPALLEIGAFPQTEHGIDSSKAEFMTRWVVVRLKDQSAEWNGSQFSQLNTPVLVPPGFLVVRTKMQSLKVLYDDGAQELDSQLKKLIAGRAQLAIGLEQDIANLLKRPEYEGRFEILPAPFAEAPFFAMFSKQYYAEHTAQVEAFWRAIQTVRHSPEYAAAVRALE